MVLATPQPGSRRITSLCRYNNSKMLFVEYNLVYSLPLSFYTVLQKQEKTWSFLPHESQQK